MTAEEKERAYEAQVVQECAAVEEKRGREITIEDRFIDDTENMWDHRLDTNYPAVNFWQPILVEETERVENLYTAIVKPGESEIVYVGVALQKQLVDALIENEPRVSVNTHTTLIFESPSLEAVIRHVIEKK